MLYTVEQLARKLKRSTQFARLCIDRYSIRQIRLKLTRQLVYDVSKEKLKEIMEYSNGRRQNKRNRYIQTTNGKPNKNG